MREKKIGKKEENDRFEGKREESDRKGVIIERKKLDKGEMEGRKKGGLKQMKRMERTG